MLSKIADYEFGARPNFERLQMNINEYIGVDVIAIKQKTFDNECLNNQKM